MVHTLTPSDPLGNELFGLSVALGETRALVGAPQHFNGRGSAYLFDVTTGQQLFKLTASDGTTGSDFGDSVALSGSLVLVGAPIEMARRISGSAYLFDTVTGEQLLKFIGPPSPESGGNFGKSVALFGNIALIGAGLSAYLFRIDPTPEPGTFCLAALALVLLISRRSAASRPTLH